MSLLISRVLTGLLVSLYATVAFPADCLGVHPAPKTRLLVAISDLHLGVGRNPAGGWDPTEDARWPRALAGFLKEVSACGADGVDLVIAGDALELWQPPAELKCEGPADSSCRPDQLLSLIKLVATAHAAEFGLLGEFAKRGTNRLYFIPGNHDAALLLPGAWDMVKHALGAPERASLVRSGTWISEDGETVIQHGHQIGEDVNRFRDWPDITRKVGGQEYVETPWGERFVQKLFNSQELLYPIIDNLSPESAGARYRMSDRGVWGSATDVARFLRFNLFETSLSQKSAALGAPDVSKPYQWDIPLARSLGHQLFTLGLPTDDAFLISLQQNDKSAAAVRLALDALANNERELPDDDVRMLCDVINIRTNGKRRCTNDLGAAAQAIFRSKTSVMTAHLRSLLGRSEFGRTQTYIYGHTHQFEEGWDVQATDGDQITVFNTGAFQRVVDEEGFLSRAAQKGLKPSEALRAFTVEDLAPCYGAVLVGLVDGARKGKTLLWSMGEEDGATGSFVLPGTPSCQ